MNTISNYGVNAYTSYNQTNTKNMSSSLQVSDEKNDTNGVELKLSSESLNLNRANSSAQKIESAALIKATNIEKEAVQVNEEKASAINQFYQNPRVSNQQDPNSAIGLGQNFDIRL